MPLHVGSLVKIKWVRLSSSTNRKTRQDEYEQQLEIIRIKECNKNDKNEKG